MRKLHCIFIGLCCSSAVLFAQSVPDKMALVGTWQQVDSLGQPLPIGNKMTEYKVITPQTFTVIQAFTEKSLFAGVFMGEYTLDGDTYIEKISLCSPNAVSMVGAKNMFTVFLKGDILSLHGINNMYRQYWKKLDRLPVAAGPATDVESVKRKADSGNVTIGKGDGSSVDNAVVIEAKNENAGVAAEYEWIGKKYGMRNADWVVTRQETLGAKGRHYDLLFVKIVATGEVMKIYFDITGFFGRF